MNKTKSSKAILNKPNRYKQQYRLLFGVILAFSLMVGAVCVIVFFTTRSVNHVVGKLSQDAVANEIQNETNAKTAIEIRYNRVRLPSNLTLQKESFVYDHDYPATQSISYTYSFTGDKTTLSAALKAELEAQNLTTYVDNNNVLFSATNSKDLTLRFTFNALGSLTIKAT